MSAQPMFRIHDRAPEDIVSTVFSQLITEWVHLCSTPSSPAQIRRWARHELVLEPYSTPEAILAAIDAGSPADKDALLLALIRLSHAGQRLAGRVVLQAMLPKLAKISHYGETGISSTSTWAEERRHVTLAEFWEVLASYPVQRRPQRVAANLALDTLNRITQGAAASRPRDVLVDPQDPLDNANTTTRSPFDQPTTATKDIQDYDLDELIRWALQGDVLTRDEGEILTIAYIRPKGEGYGFHEAGIRFGLTETAVRKRCQRATQKLTHAVQAELHSAASDQTRLHVA